MRIASRDSGRFTPTCVGKSGGGSWQDRRGGSPPRVWGNRHGDSRRPSTVHPHVCGEIGRSPGQLPVLRFTPTCVGKSSRAVKSAAAVRFTPTCVGKSRRSSALLDRTVHPHVCGEIFRAEMPPPRGGSPPRVWGNLRSRLLTCVATVHPHVCGEITAAVTAGQTYRFTPTCVGKSARGHGDLARTHGSPPRVWGNRRADRHVVTVSVHPHVCGEITRQRATTDRHDPVHPHVCGEIAAVRPLHVSAVHPHVCGEIASADVESPGSPAVHPHVCGEIAALQSRAQCRSGSPPRVWGNRLADRGTRVASGSPPRVWGNRRAAAIGCQRAVHPHVCGEILRHTWRRCEHCRFTPTCVGKSPRLTQSQMRNGSPPRVWGNLRVGRHVDSAAVHPHVCGEI